MLDRYVFDLDNTLIFTNSLNNDSYNFALSKLNLPTIGACRERLTRAIIFKSFPFLNEDQKSKLVGLKQEYFIRHINQTRPNKELIDKIRFYGPQACILWTSADEKRVIKLLEHYNLQEAFKKIYYSRKTNVEEDISKISKLLCCGPEQIVFYEDNPVIIEKLKSFEMVVMTVKS